MKSIVLAISILALGMSSASADPIADRKASMKERGGLVGQLAPMVKGEKPFDAAKVAEVFAALEANAAKHTFEALYPETSKTGDTKASPKIWDDPNGYKAAIAKYQADVTAAAATKPQDADALRAAFGQVTANCGGCHQAWRL